MLNSGWASSYKNLARKAETRECRVSDEPVVLVIVDFRSRLFRYMRLAYANRTQRERALSVFRTMRDLRLTGEVVAEKRRVYDAALAIAKREVAYMRVPRCTFVSLWPALPAQRTRADKKRRKDRKQAKELKKRISVYRSNMFDLDALEQCALALESYVISDIEGVSTMHANGERFLGVDAYRVPGESDDFESDRLCARLAMGIGSAVLSEDFDVVALFGADLMVTEAHKNFFVYISLRDVMETFCSVSRKDAVHKCCLMGTDYNWGLKGIGPVKAKKIDAAEAKKLLKLAWRHSRSGPAPCIIFSWYEPAFLQGR